MPIGAGHAPPTAPRRRPLGSGKHGGHSIPPKRRHKVKQKTRNPSSNAPAQGGGAPAVDRGLQMDTCGGRPPCHAMSQSATSCSTQAPQPRAWSTTHWQSPLLFAIRKQTPCRFLHDTLCVWGGCTGYRLHESARLHRLARASFGLGGAASGWYQHRATASVSL
jgi:hypothetical protein